MMETSKRKGSFVLHVDALAVLDELTDEQNSKLFKLCRDYNDGKEITTDDPVLRAVFVSFRNQFDRDTERWHEIVEQKRIAGSKGGYAKNRSTNNDQDAQEDEKQKMTNEEYKALAIQDTEWMQANKFKGENTLNEFIQKLTRECKTHDCLENFKQHCSRWWKLETSKPPDKKRDILSETQATEEYKPKHYIDPKTNVW